MAKQQKLHVRKGDQVFVLSGKDRGKQGEIMMVLPEKKRAIVEGVNMMKKHVRPDMHGQGGLLEMEGTIHLSNLKLICPKCNRPTRTKRRSFEKVTGEERKIYRMRCCQHCNHEFGEQ